MAISKSTADRLFEKGLQKVDGRYTFHNAIRDNDEIILSSLVNKGIDINEINEV